MNKIPLTDIHSLAQDRPLVTTEGHKSNDFYGNAYVLKKFLDIPMDYQFKAAVEHGPFSSTFAWHADLEAKVPGLLIPASYRYPFLTQKTDKSIFAIGPTLHYAEQYLSDEELHQEKERLGNCLLVVPVHSTHHVDVNYDIDALCKQIEVLAREFDSVRVCLYWKDILRGLNKIYEAYGFECVSAGHMFDMEFLPRLKGILECCSMTLTNGHGTHIGYSVLMGKPVWYFPQEAEIDAQNKQIYAKDKIRQKDFEEYEALLALFKEPVNEPTAGQKDAIKERWGLSDIKPKHELLNIIQITEDLYYWQRENGGSGKSMQVNKALDYMAIKKYGLAEQFISQIQTLYGDSPELTFYQSVSLLRSGKTEEGLNYLMKFLPELPLVLSIQAQRLLNEFNVNSAVTNH